MSMGLSWALVAAVMTVVGTVTQAVSAFGEMREQNAEVLRAAVVVRDLRDEHRWWRPVARWKQRRLVKELLAESPLERSAYDRVNRMLLSWSMLATAALMVTVGLVIDALG